MNQVAPKKFRPEIQGLRAVAALLVAIYHIWMGRISGAVDVFFVVSGYLVIGTLLRQVERSGRVQFMRFYGSLAKRLLPNALLVIVFVLVASLFLMPASRWRTTMFELLASTLYLENWLLARLSVDYLARNDVVSPVLHYWAMAVQGQFYLLWPVIITGIALTCRLFHRNLRTTATVVLATIFCASLAWSIYFTTVNQSVAYYDTASRMWEFAAGGLLALWYPRIRLSTASYTVLGWTGTILIIICGLVLKVSTVFPGYAALWPVGATLLVLIAGTEGGRFGAHRFLASRFMMRLGDVSYALYLWAWALLAFWLLLVDKHTAGLWDGLAVLGVAIALSFLSTRWVETPIRSSGIGKQKPWRAVALGLSMIAPVAIAISAWGAYIYQQRWAAQDLAVDAATYPGALARLPNAAQPPRVPFVPTPLQAPGDVSIAYQYGCQINQEADGVKVCEFGPENALHTVALIGGSHSTHWLPALRQEAYERDFRIITYLKGGCPFTASAEHGAQCQQWNEEVIQSLSQAPPDVIVTTATRGHGADEHVPPAYLEQWRRVEPMGIPILAIRDNPWFGFNVPDCVERHGADSPTCERKRSDVLADAEPWLTLSAPPPHVHFADYSRLFCDPAMCQPVIGNVLVYFDSDHISATYARSLAPMVWDDIVRTSVQPVQRHAGAPNHD